MSIAWKIIRIIGLYVGSFFVCIIIAAIALDSLPDAIEALFALLAPMAFVWWYEKRRSARMAEKSAPEKTPSIPLSSKVGRATNSRPDKSGQFEPELGRVGQIAADAVRRSTELRQQLDRGDELSPQAEGRRQTSSARPQGRHQGWVPNRLAYAAVLFMRMTVMAKSIGQLLPDCKPKEHWDFSAVASLTRNLAEAYLWYFWLCEDEVEADVRQGRFILLYCHDHGSRGRMFPDMKPSVDEDVVLANLVA